MKTSKSLTDSSSLRFNCRKPPYSSMVTTSNQFKLHRMIVSTILPGALSLLSKPDVKSIADMNRTPTDLYHSNALQFQYAKLAVPLLTNICTVLALEIFVSVLQLSMHAYVDAIRLGLCKHTAALTISGDRGQLLTS